MQRVLIFDTTLRDGEQSPGASMTVAEKLRLGHQLDALGVDIIEAGFPASSPADMAGVREIARELKRPVIAALARAVPDDIDRAAAALESAERGRIHVFIATSETHLRHKFRIDQNTCLNRAVAAVEHARRYTDDVEFSAEDATRTDVAFLCRVVEAVIAAGARTVNIPDTVGYSHPAEIARIISTLKAAVPGIDDIVLSVHCHDDLGLAVANSLAGVEAGARQVECTINGIGERAGNAALEEIVMALRARADAYPYETGVVSTELFRTSHLLTHITGIHPQPNKAIVGRNAFAHEAGIHQDGMLKERTTYEIISPETVGVRGSQLVLGRHSGRHALAQHCRELGFELNEEEVEKAYHLFKLLAEQKKEILDEDVIAILHHGRPDDAQPKYKLRELQVACGTARAKARVRIAIDGRDAEADAEGDGPIAAAFTAIDQLIHDHRVELKELNVQAITAGRDAVGDVSVQVLIDGRSFTGRGAATDIVNAAVRAYLHALNKAAVARGLEAEALERASYLWGV
ncbi:MAG: 2-isopropylmalate synthase [Gemmatimonadota bacterium]